MMRRSTELSVTTSSRRVINATISERKPDRAEVDEISKKSHNFFSPTEKTHAKHLLVFE